MDSDMVTDVVAKLTTLRDISAGDHSEIQRLMAIAILMALPSAGIQEAFTFLGNVHEFYAVERSLPEANIDPHPIRSGRVFKVTKANETFLED